MHVSGHFGIILSTKTSLIEVLLSTSTDIKVVVPRNMNNISKRSWSTYIQTLMKTTGMLYRVGKKVPEQKPRHQVNSRGWNE